MPEASSPSRIYLDHNATTPLRDEVVEAMLPLLREQFGNPSSTHTEGAAARAAIEDARERVAALLGAAAREIFFTGGATEANNTVVRGLARGATLVTTTSEHPSIVAPVAAREAQGFPVTRLAVDAGGLVELGQLEEALKDTPGLVSILWANNETGVMQPLAQIAEIVKGRGLLLHVDATQAVGKAVIDLASVPIDLLSSSAHKLNGPKGVGCLFVREGVAVESLLLGGPQERRFRGGTENVAGIAGYGIACELAARELPERTGRYRGLRDRLWNGLSARADLRRNGDEKTTLPNTLNVEFRGIPGDVLVQALDLEGVAVSAGAACHSGSITPSHVLTAMGRSPQEARSSLRLSVGLGNDEAQIDRAVESITSLLPRVRGTA